MRMDQKNLTNGSVRISMLVTGKTIKRMDLVFSITRMEINTKVDGARIKGMDKELFGYVTQKTNSVDNTQVTGRMMRKKEEELCSSNQEIDMMECGWIANLMEKAE